MYATETRGRMDHNLMVLVAAFWLAALVILFMNCASTPNFWFDESGQFWMSRGQTHFMAPLTADGPLAAVLQANRTANSDPGGFTVLLHWWLIGGSAPAWLRTLPFLFFILTMVGFAAVSYVWTGNPLVSLSTGLLPASAPLLTRYAFELRAYSMEACGVVVIIWLVDWIAKRPTAGRYFALGVVAALFLTSRYSLICTVAAAPAAIWWNSGYVRSGRRISFLVAYCVPVALACLGIYLVTLGHPLAHQKPEPPDYVQAFILNGKSATEMLRIIGRSLLSSYAASVVFVATYLVCYFRRIKESQYQVFSTLFNMVVLVNIGFLVLSLLGKYPWCPQERWGISQNLLSALCLLPTIWMIWRGSNLRLLVSGTLFSVLIAVGTGAGAVALGANTRLTPDDHDHIYANLLALGPENLHDKVVFVSMTAQPSVRYLFEYGPLKRYADGIYPGHFLFEVVPNPALASRPIDYFLSPESIRKGEFAK